ncbi:murein L,D-transpeptidase family protein [Bradyrhizobium sp. WD16]|uniref:L,D-transpeptidase family protein n=1 Tax=Bradyrhizobium sp. WD16 TaxID=1521768 RepID=UPI0020A5621B|nr:murein L,D-transpeptidase family protein [Bradyrhizobium sp. WD16]UTD26692.1 hypothetical protein DB459_06900 [Bradyrhizobium sp. WD16]
MKSRLPVRALVASAAAAASLALAGCDGDSLSTSAKANKPIPEKLVAEMDAKNMDKASPMLVRLFKQEAELEVWKQDRNGRFALLKTYPICRWSGDLGPKVREGDRQAPEGFYTITPAQMNPQSAYYLSFNMGYPNAFDRSLGRTGSQLMVHGDCSSRGCYAMTDEQISEIYSLGREAFFGGQRAFQVQAYPFRMTPQNFAKHRDNPNMPFWKMIKEGSDHFEMTRQEPKVDVCDRHYVFDAQPPAGSTKPLSFNPTGACPAYQIPEEIADAVREKQREDEIKTAELIGRGTPQARRNTGIDGGMNAVFAAKIPNGQTGLSDPTTPNFSVASYSPAPGTIPPTVNPPQAPEPRADAGSPANGDNPALATTSHVATVAPAEANAPAASTGGFFGNLAKKVGLRRTETTASTTASTSAPTPAPKPLAARLATAVAAIKPGAKSADHKSAGSKSRDSQTAEAKPLESKALDNKASDNKASDNKASDAKPMAQAVARTKPTTIEQAIAGAQPVVPTNSFDGRWTSFR